MSTGTTPPPAPPPSPPPPAARPSSDRTWAILAHVSGFLGFFTGFGHVVAPLVIWLVYRGQSPEVEHHAREALNFQISMTIYWIVVALLWLVVIGVFLTPILAIVHVVLMILGAVKASEGVRYTYPLTIRLIR